MRIHSFSSPMHAHFLLIEHHLETLHAKSQQIRLLSSDCVCQSWIMVFHGCAPTDRPKSRGCRASGAVVNLGTDDTETAGSADSTHAAAIRDGEIEFRLLCRLSRSCSQPQIRGKLTTHFDISGDYSKGGVSDNSLALHTRWAQSLTFSEFDPGNIDVLWAKHNTERLHFTNLE